MKHSKTAAQEQHALRRPRKPSNLHGSAPCMAFRHDHEVNAAWVVVQSAVSMAREVMRWTAFSSSGRSWSMVAARIACEVSK